MCVRYLRFSKILKLILLSLFINLIFVTVSFASVTWVPTTSNVESLALYDYLIQQASIDDSQSNFTTQAEYNNYLAFRDIVYTAHYYGGNFYLISNYRSS